MSLQIIVHCHCLLDFLFGGRTKVKMGNSWNLAGKNAGLSNLDIYRVDPIFWPDINNQIPDIVCALEKIFFG